MAALLLWPWRSNPHQHLAIAASFEQEARLWRFDGPNQLGLLTNLATLRLSLNKQLGRAEVGLQVSVDKRLGRYGLKLHPDKTRGVDFRRPGRGKPPGRKPQTFDFLGFTHYWGKTRRGANAVKQKTAKDRFSRSLRRIRQWCREHRHDSLRAHQQALARKLRGYYGYFGIAWNYGPWRNSIAASERHGESG